MNNKLILVHHHQPLTPEYINAQTQSLQRILLRVHTLYNFLVSYDLFNVKKRKTVTKTKAVTNLYYTVEPPAFHFVIGKN